MPSLQWGLIQMESLESHGFELHVSWLPVFQCGRVAMERLERHRFELHVLGFPCRPHVQWGRVKLECIQRD
jgi:hypothetical protein